jgi:Zn-dependent protease with chaperone function
MTGIVKRDVPIGWCVVSWDRVILPTEMKGKLDPEEWRPLLASSLIYEAMLSLRRNLGFVILSTPIIIDALGWWELLAVSTPGSAIPALLLILDIAGLFGALALSGLLAKRFSRRLRLRADTLAAELVGRQALETVLEKMEAQGLVDSYAGVTWGGGYPFSSELMNGRPTLAERITNLKRTR